MSYNLIFIDESESLKRAVSAVFVDNPEFELTLVDEPSAVYKAAKNFIPDIIVLGYNTIDTEIKKSITEIKTSKEFSNIPLILLVPSDLSDNERETLIKLKADGFIYRPFDKETFISKIKRTINGSDTASDASGNSVKAENAAEKIYDIGAFEIKKTEENAAVNAAAENAGDTRGDNKEPENNSLESSELSQAFENLFKDDAIFKEFQDLNKKEEPEKAESEEELAPPAETIEPEPKPEPIAAVMPEEIFEPAEPGDNGTFIISEPDGSSEPVKPAEIFELDAPNEAFESAVSFDSIALQKLPEEHHKDASAFDEPFSGFNIALGGDNEKAGKPGTYKLDMNINTDESKGELNLKILDEQNLVKLEDYLKNAIEKTIDDIKPQIIEAVKTSLPEIIEKLVKEEIEKIKQQ